MKQFCRKLLMLIIFIDGMTILCTALLYLLAVVAKVSVENIWFAGFKAAIVVVFVMFISKYFSLKNQ